MKAGCHEFHQFNRRDALRIGGATFFGLTMPQLLRARAESASTRPVKAKQVLLVWMYGGPSQIDMFDLKPNAKREVSRPLFRPIQTALPDLQVSELMPRMAQIADKYTVLRSMWVGGLHWQHSALPYLLTGNARTPNTLAYPTMGSVVAKVKGGPRDVPNYIALNQFPSKGADGVPGAGDCFLGPAYEPLVLQPDVKNPMSEMLAAPGLDVSGFERRTNLMRNFDQKLRGLDRLEPIIEAMDQHQQKAFDMLRSPKIRDAFDLSKEGVRTIERYGKSKHPYGGGDQNQALLVGRRLIEAGVPFVHVDYQNWDWHGVQDNVTNQPKLVPQWDRGMSALLEDMDARGLLEETMVVAMGEQGRGPIDRSHWSGTHFVLLAGGGFARGRVVGATDQDGMKQADYECFPEDLAATIYNQLGIDPHAQLMANGNRPVRIVDKDDIKILRRVLA
ncbi:MAG: DUF1501 domain-containing protein [Planctomycetes bacterium]|nr:DUF1501 domain-containing protein [Planctomycetota bacterium]